MATFTLLDQGEEDKLHATRLLSVEEKPFKRITKRLLAPTSPIQSFSASRLATPPSSNAADEDQPHSSSSDPDTQPQPPRDKYLSNLYSFRTATLLDFATFTASIARLQFLRSANGAERERYAAEKERILHTAGEVRADTARLRVRLDEAQRLLAVRKTYDELAGGILGGERALKPRAEQGVAIEKLRVEIEDLEREGREMEGAWVERRGVWGGLVEEAFRVRRVVRGEVEPDEEQAKTDGDGTSVGEDGRRDGDDDDEMMDAGRDGGEGGSTPLPPAEDAVTPEAEVMVEEDLAAAVATPGPEPLRVRGRTTTAAEDDERSKAASGRSKLNIVETAGDQMDTT